MSIPASQIVSINPRLLQPGGTDLELNGLLLSSSPLIPSSQFVLPFPDAESVGDYFGLESAEYAAASVYFLGYNNSFKKPRALYIAPRVSEDTPAFIRGGSFTTTASQTLQALQEITAGALSLTLGSETVEAAGLDFASATSLSGIAEIIQNALTESIPATAATLTGGAIDLAALSEITDGSFDIQIDGINQSVSGLSFADADLPGIAASVQARLSGASVSATANGLLIASATTGAAGSVGFATPPASGADVSGLLGLTEATGAVSVAGTDASTESPVVAYSSQQKAFTITSAATGENAGVGYASGSAAAALNLTEATGAVLSPGMNGMTEAENMEAICEVTRNWAAFTNLDAVDETAALAFAKWAASKGNGVDYLYVFWDDNPLLLQPNSAATIAAALKEANAGATAGVYNSPLYAAFILGSIASIDWERRNGTITFAFKAQDGLPANVITGTNAQNLEAQNMNFMGDYATRNDQFIFMYPGCMFGQWEWIDTFVNAIWLNNALQVALMAGLSQSPRTPYTDDGYTLIRAWAQDPINRALNNGVIEPGVTLSELQKAQLFREAGRDISEELFTNGYVFQVVDASPMVRQQRESPSCSLWYTYGGAIHHLDLASTAVV